MADSGGQESAATEVQQLPEVDRSVVAEVVAALAYGERLGARRAAESVKLAPDRRSRVEQLRVADRERQNSELINARLSELGEESLAETFKPYFDSFFERTQPADWLEAQTFHYVGDAIVSDLADVLVPLVDRVSAEIIRRALGDREDEEIFALDELTRLIDRDSSARERIGRYARRIAGEALTQTSRALDSAEGLRSLFGGDEGGKAFVLHLLGSHRQRLDRLGIEAVELD